MRGKSKPTSTLDILGLVFETYRKGIEFQFTPEMNCLNFEIDHDKPDCLFDISKDEELRECFNWKNSQPLF